MSLTKSAGLLAGTAALSLAGGSLAGTGAEADRNQDLETRLAAAEAKIAQLTDGQSTNWLTEQRAGEIRSLVQDVLADADTRASLLTQGVTAGYDGGAVLGSADGNFLLRTNIHMQQRFMYRNTDMAGDEQLWGFENTRTKFIMTGHVASPDWFYRIDHNIGSGNRNGTLNAYAGYDYGDGTKVMIGTMKAPLLREELVESHHQLAVERSALNGYFTGGYTDGVAFSGGGEGFRWTGALTNGAGTGPSRALMQDTEFAFTFRVEGLMSGTWDQFDDFTSPQGSEQGTMIGGALHYQKAEFGAGGGANELETTVLTLDASIEDDGWNAFFAFMYANLDNDAAIDLSPWGIVIQGGMYFSEDMEAFLRCEFSDSDSSAEDLSILTIGINKYFAEHNAKWTTDLVFGIDEIDSSFGAVNSGLNPDTGLRTDASGQDGQLVLRTQVSLFF